MSGVHLGDGTSLQSTWDLALSHAVLHFRQLIASSSSPSWKTLPVNYPSSSGTRTPPSGSLLHQNGRTTMHKRATRSGDIYRAVYEVHVHGEGGGRGDLLNIEAFRGALIEAESRATWDRLVEGASTLEVLDVNTRLVHVKYRLGWPSSPRDSINIQRHYIDDNSLLLVSTSIPQTNHDPIYIRNMPPYVRANITINAWHVQIVDDILEEGLDDMSGKRLRITCFSNFDARGSWAVGSNIPQQLPATLRNLQEYIMTGQSLSPSLCYYAPHISIDHLHFDPVRTLLALDYSVVRNEEGEEEQDEPATLVFKLPGQHSWDVEVMRRSGGGDEEDLGVTIETGNRGLSDGDTLFAKIRTPRDGQYIKRYKINLERTMGIAGDVRFNGVVQQPDEDLHVQLMQLSPTSLLGDSASLLSEMSLQPTISLDTMTPSVTRKSSLASTSPPKGLEAVGNGTAAASHKRQRSASRSISQDKALASLIKRNYIHFTALLQEPEAKWKIQGENKGVTTFHLDSIDKSLAIYRVEAVFVGVGLWDLFAILMNWDARSSWDKAFGEATLLEQVNEMSEVWRVSPKGRPATNLLRTTYKSSNAMHIFSFSPPSDLFRHLPSSPDTTTVNADNSLAGWSLERLSPTTIQISRITQVDARNSGAKVSLSAMAPAMSALGELAIKAGGPPVISRLNGAKLVTAKYDSESSCSKFAYEAAAIRAVPAQLKPNPLLAVSDVGDGDSVYRAGMETPLNLEEEKPSTMECQIRCDPDRWATLFDIVVDPPPSAFTVLKRHGLSENGGLWLTIEHKTGDSAVLPRVNVSLKAVVGASASKEKVSVHLNGIEVEIDKVELPAADIAALKRQKRTRVNRQSLDQPPAMPVLRRRTTGLPPQLQELNEGDVPDSAPPSPVTKPAATWASSIGGWMGVAATGAKSIVVPVKRAAGPSPSDQHPYNAAAIALEKLVKIHLDRFSESTTADDQWIIASRSGDAIVEKKVLPFISANLPVYRSSRIIQGSSAEDVSAVISSDTHRRSWDSAKLVDVKTLASYGDGVDIQVSNVKMAFPYKQRSIRTVRMAAKAETGGQISPVPNFNASQDSTLIFHAATSLFDISTLNLDPKSYNLPNAAQATVILEGWILETLDPYSHDQFPIPSTRCMHVVAVDYAIPAAMNGIANSALPYRILAVEKLLDASRRLPILLQPSSSILLPKALFKGRRLSENAIYGHTASKTTLISANRDADGNLQIKARINPAALATAKRPSFPAEWYEKDGSLEPPLSDDKASSRASTHSRSPSTWSRFMRSRTASQKLLRGLSETLADDPEDPADLGDPIFEIVIESSVEGEKYEIEAEIQASRAEARPFDLRCERPGHSNALPICITVEKTSSPVLRGALTDSTAYLVRVTPAGREKQDDPLNGQSSAPSLSYDWAEARKTGAILQVKISKMGQEGGGGVAFVHSGNQVAIKDLSGATSPSGRSGKVFRRYPVLKRLDASDDIVPEPANLLAIDKQYLTSLPESIPELKVIEVEEEGAIVTAEPTAIEITSASDKDVPTVIQQRPATLRMNTIYTYLTRPNRFSWPGTPLATKADVNPIEAVSADPAPPPPSTDLPPVTTIHPLMHPSTVILLVCTSILFFLLGSLTRALLGDHEDFFTFLPSNFAAIEPEWQEMRRVVEVKLWKWHIVLAVLRGRLQ